jgi:dihydrofolate reductase
MEGGKNILIDGGARVINSLLSFRLIDELIISTIPILLGDGIRLFREGRPEQKLEVLSSNSFETGLVQNHYKVIR